MMDKKIHENLLEILIVLTNIVVKLVVLEDIVTKQNCIDFLNEFTLAFINQKELDSNLSQQLVEIATTSFKVVEYPDYCTFQYTQLHADEEHFMQMRPVIGNLFVNAATCEPIQDEVLNNYAALITHIHQNLNEMTPNEIEVVIYLLQRLQHLFLHP